MKSTVGILDKSIVSHHEPAGVASETFRVLRTNLQFMGLDTPLRSVLITSATPGEGKSTVVANLAVTFAHSGARVCVVDGDLRRPMVAKLFGVQNWRGLTTTLIGQSSLEECTQATMVENLSILPSGPIPPNPAELLGSGRMAALLEKLEALYDIILVDSPPVLAVTDAAVLAPKTDGVILIVRSGMVSQLQATRAKEALANVKARLLGVILTAMPSESGSGYYYYYEYGTGSARRRK